jgi:hypothetical protein
MSARRAGDFDYETRGGGYAGQRHTDPRIAAYVHAALGPARTVLNVGAGAGSYEPQDRDVTAVEPSATMRAQRPPHLAAAHGTRRYGVLRTQPAFTGSLRLITARPG